MLLAFGFRRLSIYSRVFSAGAIKDLRPDQSALFLKPDIFRKQSKAQEGPLDMKSTSCIRPLHLSMTLLFISCGLACGASSAPAPSAAGRSGTAPPSNTIPNVSSPNIEIPGPLRSFLRMAAISQKISPNDVVPLLARNVAMEGYGWHGKRPAPTEYLLLLKGYLQHARELKALAGPQGVIHVSSCAAAQPLLSILGYRLRPGCGLAGSLVTADPKRAFLTIDSGFPLTDLEDSLREGKAFAYAFPSSQVPIMFSSNAWMVDEKTKRNARKPQENSAVDSLVSDPALARLYWALAQMDPDTRSYLRNSVGLKKLIPLAAALNFYGADICIRFGRVMTPGGVAAMSGWRSLVGANPNSPRPFIIHLLTRDEGWLAAYFDALSRVSGSQQAYFTNPRRLRSFYRALRGQSASPSPVRPVFRPDPGLLLLASQLQLDPTGRPSIPGGLEVWKEMLDRDFRSHSKVVRSWAVRAKAWQNPDQLVAAMFAFSRIQSEDNPLRLFLVLTEIDRRRPSQMRLSPQTVRLLADKFPVYGDQYAMFSEFGDLDNSSIIRFIRVAESLGRIRDRALRADAIGIFQANVGLWQILARQGEIPTSHWNQAWQATINSFAQVGSAPRVFDAAHKSLAELTEAVSGVPQVSQDEVIDLLAGPSGTGPEGQQVEQKLAYRIRSVLDAQRLVSLDALFALGNDLNRMAQGEPMPRNLIQLAGALRGFRMPKPLFTSGERAEWSYGLFSNPHIQAERNTNLVRFLKASHSERQLAMARGQLVPFLRDTLVGLNYAYYAPPAAQVLYNSAYFVRSHDFSGQAIMGRDQSWKTPTILGRGWTASGGAHLVGSLADLPYVLAEVEQDFIVPRNVQALIWEDLVPTLLTDSVVPRWWRVTPTELHAVTLYQNLGTELVTAASKNAELRERVVNILSNRMLPEKITTIGDDLGDGHPNQALSQMAVAQIFYLAAEFRRLYPHESSQWGPAGRELDRLSQQYPNQVSWRRLSEDFGVPHPALAETYACELLDVKPFPTFLGYSSRLLAESWQSNNLYWARLADQAGYPPAMLNLLVPDLTRRMIANIFATDLQDRPALLRALRETGTEFRRGLLASASSRSRVGAGS